jgi:DNA replication and repair protein RecF
MFLKHLSLTNFRNFTRLDVDIPRRVVLLVGANAQGKTSILEAIYFLAAFTSFQTMPTARSSTSTNREAIR